MSTRSLSARVIACIFTLGLSISAQASPPAKGLELYQQLKAFTISNQVVHVEKFTLKRELVEITFSGDFFLAAPIDNKIYGAVFRGTGRVKSEPWSAFEKDCVRRLLRADRVDVDFQRAVLRFTDDTVEQVLRAGGRGEQTWLGGQEAASEVEPRTLKETGLNLSGRMALAILSHDEPGFFFAEFDGGKTGRFGAIIDRQSRSLSNTFGLNGGEKGMLYQYKGVLRGVDVWTSFYDDADFKRGTVSYSDVFDLFSTPNHRMTIDLRSVNDWLRIDHEIDIVSARNDLPVLSFSLNEGLDAYDNERLKKGARVKTASLSDGTELPVVQDPWDTDFYVFLPRPLARGEKITLRLRTEAKDPFLTWQSNFNYPLNTTTWYPRHGYLTRTKYDLTFLHKAKSKVISVGDRASEGPIPAGGEGLMTRWVEDDPVSFISFAVGPFQIHTEIFNLKDRKIPVEFYSAPGAYAAIKEDFVVAELLNGVNFFSTMFGDYRYKRLGAVYFPSFFGQGFPSMLFLPVEGRANLNNFSFIAHEGAHQWWGNFVAWRSYRDQWLSEGFAEYSGALYAASRKSPKEAMELVHRMRRTLMLPMYTDTGISDQKMYESGPLIMGHRLSSRRSRGAYTLVYDKGALVLRMMHFLFSDPNTGDDRAFFEMMKDFVARHQNGWASTESFFAVASEHISKSSLGKRYKITDLNWFAQQWLYGSELPKYRLSYHFEPNPAGGVFLVGTIYQENVADNFFMPVPLVLDFGDKQRARGTIPALGKKTPVRVPLPSIPKRVQLDPDLWILSEKTSEDRGD
jgi:hypothetical protein